MYENEIWMESDKMIPLSRNLIRELKTFIAKGKSFEAKLGETDDLVSATLLCIRQIQVISNSMKNIWKLVNHLIVMTVTMTLFL